MKEWMNFGGTSLVLQIKGPDQVVNARTPSIFFTRCIGKSSCGKFTAAVLDHAILICLYDDVIQPHMMLSPLPTWNAAYVAFNGQKLAVADGSNNLYIWCWNNSRWEPQRVWHVPVNCTGLEWDATNPDWLFFYQGESRQRHVFWHGRFLWMKNVWAPHTVVDMAPFPPVRQTVSA